MTGFCRNDPGNPNCLEWLRAKRKPAMSTYSDICSKHMDARYCSEFIRIIRPDYFTLGIRHYTSFVTIIKEIEIVGARIIQNLIPEINI